MLAGTNQRTVDSIYPVGALYLSMVKVDPEKLFGGKWEQLQADAYLKIVTDGASAEAKGNTDHKITVAQMPSHKHTQDGHNHLMVSPTDGAGSGEYMAGRYNADRNSNYPTRSITSTSTPTIHETGGASVLSRVHRYLRVLQDCLVLSKSEVQDVK